jgi:hypothetical protein
MYFILVFISEMTLSTSDVTNYKKVIAPCKKHTYKLD